MVALNLSTEFGKKDFIARCSAIKRLCVLIRLSIEWACMYASTSQRKMRRRQATSCASLSPSIRPSWQPAFHTQHGSNPVYFLMSTKKTLKLVEKTINICTSMNNTRQATVAVRIAGDGKVLPLTIIFKGKHDGHIAQSEFATFPARHHYCCQDAEWMEKACDACLG